MALTDCEKCWNTSCTCGWEYKDYKENFMSERIASMLNYRSEKEQIEILKEVLILINSYHILYDRRDDELQA